MIVTKGLYRMYNPFVYLLQSYCVYATIGLQVLYNRIVDYL